MTNHTDACHKCIKACKLCADACQKCSASCESNSCEMTASKTCVHACRPPQGRLRAARTLISRDAVFRHTVPMLSPSSHWCHTYSCAACPPLTILLCPFHHCTSCLLGSKRLGSSLVYRASPRCPPDSSTHHI